LESGLLKPSALELDAALDDLDPAALEWARIKRSVNRLSIRDLTAAIVPAIHAHKGRMLVAVDDLTAVNRPWSPSGQRCWTMLAAVVISLRVFLFRGSGKAN